tara:strand:- start:175 stop:654 length:480 start_codon:yes stop_codon:yes gene_type:complete
MNQVVPLAGGERFLAGEDEARLIVSGNDTDGRYSLLEWTVAAVNESETSPRDYGPHLHRRYEETFHIQEGSLEFLIGEHVVTLNTGDFVRVPPGTKHGYLNVSGAPVKMLVMFSPGGMEELFLKYRTDQEEIKGAGFVSDATRYHGSEFGLPNPKPDGI